MEYANSRFEPSPETPRHPNSEAQLAASSEVTLAP
jgi:hypothetical protein